MTLLYSYLQVCVYLYIFVFSYDFSAMDSSAVLTLSNMAKVSRHNTVHITISSKSRRINKLIKKTKNNKQITHISNS